MANINAPFGFRSVAPKSGGVYGRQNSDYNIADQLAVAISIGDIIYFAAASAPSLAPAVDPRYAGQYITGTATGAPAGVFCGAAWQDTLGNYIWGKNWLGFELGATLDFVNVQLVPRDQHDLKTNATAKTTAETGITQRFDFRNTVIMARLVAMRERVLARLKANGGAWTLAEQLKAYRKELRK